MTKQLYLVQRRTNGKPKKITPVFYHYNKIQQRYETDGGSLLSPGEPGRGRPANLPLQLFRVDRRKGKPQAGTWHLWSPELQAELELAVTSRLLAHGLASGLPKSDLKVITAILMKNHPELYQGFKG